MSSCSSPSETPLCIVPGRAFDWTLRPAVDDLSYAEIAEYVGIAPLRATVPAHNLAQDWPFSIVDVSGMIPDSGPMPAQVIDADTLELVGQIGPMPAYSGGFEPYDGGHFVRSQLPLSLAGASATWVVFDGAEILLEVDAHLDDVEHSVSVSLDPIETQALTFAYARHELRLTLADESELSLAVGPVCVGPAGLQDALRDIVVSLSGVGAGSGSASIP